MSVPDTGNTYQGGKETLALGERPCIEVILKGGLMKLMKKPIRLMGMVFQID